MGTPPANLGFEVAGAGAGAADSWHLATVATSWLHAGFRHVEVTGAPAADPGAPTLSPNDLTTSWTTHAATVDANAAAAPDGSITADRLRDTVANSAHYIDENASRSFLSGVTYTVGFFLKDSGSGAPMPGPRLDFGGGAIIGATPGAAAIAEVEVTRVATPPVSRVSAATLSLASGWFAVALSFTMSSPGSAKFGIGFNAGDAAAEAYAGAATGHYVWGAFSYVGELFEAEDFENAWQSGTYLRNISVIAGTAIGAVWGDGTVNPAQQEAFEGGWGNTPYLTTVLGAPAVWGALALTQEGFEREWSSNESWSATLVTPTAATFNSLAETTEKFEREWSSNENWSATLSAPTAANFDGTLATESVEDFEEVVADVEYTAAPGNLLVKTAHGLVDNTKVRLINVGGAFPTPLVGTVDYWIINKTANNWQLSLTMGGANIVLSDLGFGTQILRASGDFYWNGPDINTTI